MAEQDRYELLLPFDTDSLDFVRGFELGWLWATLRASDQPVEDEIVHVENAEMVLRMAEATGRTVQSSESNGGWMAVNFAAPEPEADNDG